MSCCLLLVHYYPSRCCHVTELAQLKAAFASQAMVLHDAILRKAVAIHAGYVIEQEGDSWSIAFHAPVEALGFCLQVCTNWVDSWQQHQQHLSG